MGTLTVKLSPPLEAQLEALVRRRGQRKSTHVREAIERLVAERSEPPKGSVLDLLNDLKGIGNGPSDLSTNKKYMRGFGK
ncbi:MAG: ribbon-helix-helix protein, CopG family [Alphaproteobacteria bacterium]|nr:ribbon-helix-helix protein, CopG family [Alphaproteobacteria bacterium]